MSMIAFHGDANLKAKAIADFDGLFPPREMELHDGRRIPMLITPDDWRDTTGIPEYLFELAQMLSIPRPTLLETIPVGASMDPPPLGVGGRYLLSALQSGEIGLIAAFPRKWHANAKSRIGRLEELATSGECTKSRKEIIEPRCTLEINDVSSFNAFSAYFTDDPVVATNHILVAMAELAARAAVTEPWLGVEHYERTRARPILVNEGGGKYTFEVSVSLQSPRRAFNARHDAVREILGKILLRTLVEAPIGDEPNTQG